MNMETVVRINQSRSWFKMDRMGRETSWNIFNLPFLPGQLLSSFLQIVGNFVWFSSSFATCWQQQTAFQSCSCGWCILRCLQNVTPLSRPYGLSPVHTEVILSLVLPFVGCQVWHSPGVANQSETEREHLSGLLQRATSCPRCGITRGQAVERCHIPWQDRWTPHKMAPEDPPPATWMPVPGILQDTSRCGCLSDLIGRDKTGGHKGAEKLEPRRESWRRETEVCENSTTTTFGNLVLYLS